MTKFKSSCAHPKVNYTLKVDKHPDNTFIGRVERGFDFLGYFLKPEMVNVSITMA